MSQDFIIRDITERDLPGILALNNANLPAVSDLTESSLEKLYEMSLYCWLIEEEKQLAGFCIILPPGIDYSSDNYRWISNTYSDFEYLDRVVIATEYQGKGYGRKIYQHWFEKSSSWPLLLEVNVKPRNEGSIIFHEKMGFKVIGEQDTESGKKRVQYMGRDN